MFIRSPWSSIAATARSPRARGTQRHCVGDSGSQGPLPRRKRGCVRAVIWRGGISRIGSLLWVQLPFPLKQAGSTRLGSKQTHPEWDGAGDTTVDGASLAESAAALAVMPSIASPLRASPVIGAPSISSRATSCQSRRSFLHRAALSCQRFPLVARSLSTLDTAPLLVLLPRSGMVRSAHTEEAGPNVCAPSSCAQCRSPLPREVYCAAVVFDRLKLIVLRVKRTDGDNYECLHWRDC